MKSTEDFMSNVFSVLGHINQAVEKDVSILLEKKVDQFSEHYNVVLRGKKEGERFVMASDMSEEQLKWYVYGLGDGLGLTPEQLNKHNKNSKRTA
ncbi:hypothetical protein [Limisalsivibrio acetivorans]|uniref:hypothetical protein n=1 Tax=Limisalsivibrio acetivorans TaxID=1304888 RepID=UPI0003B4E207|nr:hypothetical protein [Limisalsivibrio acetivorans]